MVNKSDKELWSNIKRKDKVAFEKLYTKYCDFLINYGRQLTPNDELIKDVIQKLYMDIWDKASNRVTPNHVKAYLIKSIRNNLIRELKKEQKMVDLESNHTEDYISLIDLYGNASNLENLIEKLNLSIKKLPQRQKEIIHLRYYQGIRNKEISEILNINAQSTANLLHRSILKLKTLIFSID